MIFEVISAVAISVTISLIMSVGIAYMMHRKITIDDIDGLKIVLDGKADSRHAHHPEDIFDIRDIRLMDYKEVGESDES